MTGMYRSHFTINRPWLWLLALILLPYAEFSVFFWVASRIGLASTLVLLVGTSVLGFNLLRAEGKNALSRLMGEIRRGREPEGAAKDGIKVVAGGVLLILPGFITDIAGLILLAPSLLRRRTAVERPGPSAAPSRPSIIDLQRDEWKPMDE